MRLSKRDRWLERLRSLDRWLGILNEGLVFLAMVLVLLFTFGQAVDRYLLKTTFSAHDQVAKIGLVWLVFAGTAAAYRRRENLRIDLFVTRLPPRLILWRDAVLEVTILALAILIHVKAWDVIGVAAFQQIMGTPFTNVLPYSAILLGSASIVLSCAVRFFTTVMQPEHAP